MFYVPLYCKLQIITFGIISYFISCNEHVDCVEERNESFYESVKNYCFWDFT